MMTVSSDRVPVSSSSVCTPNGSGFFVWKLFPPYTRTKYSPKPNASTMAREGFTGLLDNTAMRRSESFCDDRIVSRASFTPSYAWVLSSLWTR